MNVEVQSGVQMRRSRVQCISIATESRCDEPGESPSLSEAGQQDSPEGPISRLLVGVDLESQNDHALCQALELAQLARGTRIDIVWVPDIAATGRPCASTQEGAPSDTLAGTCDPSLDPMVQLQAHVERVIQNYRAPLLQAGASLHLHLVWDAPASALSHLALVLGSDMIVVGAHDKKMLASWLLGSTAKALVADAPCPVLVSRSRAYDAKPRIEAPETIASKRAIGLPHRSLKLSALEEIE